MYTAMKKDGTHTIILYKEDHVWIRRDTFVIPHSEKTVHDIQVIATGDHLRHFATLDQLAKSPDWITAQHNPQEKPREPEADHPRD